MRTSTLAAVAYGVGLAAADTVDLASTATLLGVAFAGVSAARLWREQEACEVCALAAAAAGGRPWAAWGTIGYGLMFVVVALSGATAPAALTLAACVGAHASLVRILATLDLPCRACVATAAGATLALLAAATASQVPIAALLAAIAAGAAAAHHLAASPVPMAEQGPPAERGAPSPARSGHAAPTGRSAELTPLP